MTLKHNYQFEAIGTLWNVEVETPLSIAEKKRIHEIIDAFDKAYSRFRDDSLVSRARAKAPSSFTFPDSVVEIFDMYVQLECITGGAVNPLVGTRLEQLGYDAHYSLRPTKTPASRPGVLAQTISRSGTTLTYRQPALLDIGAIGKGYVVDKVAEYVGLRHTQYVVDAGGDMVVLTDVPYAVGLEHPLDFSRIIGTIPMQNKSICGSSPNRRSWGEGLHHIIDATTGQPVQSDCVATWAIADTTMLADALTTALFFVPATTLKQHFGEFQYIIMRANGAVEYTIDEGEVYIGT